MRQCHFVLVAMAGFAGLFSADSSAMATAVLGEDTLGTLRGGCENSCLSGQVCGDTVDLCWTDTGRGLSWGFCIDDDDCTGVAKQRQYNLNSCKPWPNPGCRDCVRTLGALEPCGYKYHCACFDIGYPPGALTVCLQYGLPYAPQDQYYDCTYTGPPYYCRGALVEGVLMCCGRSGDVAVTQGRVDGEKESAQ